MVGIAIGMTISLAIGMSVSVSICVTVGLAIRNIVSVSQLVRLGRRLLVSVNVELDEEAQVTSEQSTSRKSRGLSSSAVTNMRQRGSVDVSKSLPSAKVDKVKVDDELGNLHCGQVFLPPDLSTSGSGVVIIVHQYMDTKVQGDDNPRHASPSIELRETQGSRGRVVEYMQEGQRLLLEGEEYSIQKLEILEVIVDHIVKFKSRCPGCCRTDGGKQTIPPEYGQNFLEYKCKEQSTSTAQDKVMYPEQCI